MILPKPTGPTNPILQDLIKQLRAKGYNEKIPFLIDLAEKIEKSERKRAEVNLSKLEKICKKDEIVVIPGKVLSSGNLKKPLTVAAVNFSMSAVEKIQDAGGKVLSINELIQENPKGTNVRIVI